MLYVIFYTLVYNYTFCRHCDSQFSSAIEKADGMVDQIEVSTVSPMLPLVCQPLIVSFVVLPASVVVKL